VFRGTAAGSGTPPPRAWPRPSPWVFRLLGIEREPQHRVTGFPERGRVGARALVAIPAAVGPLPMKEALDKGVRTLIREAECREEVERVPLLGRASSIPSPHPRHPDSAVRFRLGLRIEFLVVDVAQPAVEDLVSQGEQR